MTNKIGFAAGKIFDVLSVNDALSITKLKKETKEEEKVLFMALGWLARENKVCFEIKGKAIYVSLF